MKKIYLLGLGALLAGGASAQSLSGNDAFKARGIDGNIRVSSKVSAVQSRTFGKAAGDVVFSEDFAGGFAGSPNGAWTIDTDNQPDTVNDAFQFEEDTLRKAGINVGDFASATVGNGFAAFNPRFIRQGLGASFATLPCWAALESPVMDLSNVNPAEIASLQLSFANYIAHCCNFAVRIAVDISFDGGATYPVTNSVDVSEVDRNVVTATDNITAVAVGPIIAQAPDKSNIRMRWTWDSTVPDGNNQTSSEYFWCIDDIKVSVAADWDFKIGDAYYGDTFYEYDYLTIAEPMIQNGWPISAVLVNDGAKPGLAKLEATMTNNALGLTKVYESPEVLVGAFSDTVMVFNAFTDYDVNETWTGDWSISYRTVVNAANPDLTTDRQDSASVRAITVTDSVWSHSANVWQGDVMTTRAQLSGAYIAMPTGQTFTVPAVTQSVEVTGLRISLHDSVANAPITVPNQISYEVQKLNQVSRRGGLDANFLAYFYNENTGEVDGQIAITDNNRVERVTQNGATAPTFIDGQIFDAATGTVGSLTLVPDNFYFLSVNPSAPMNLVASGDPDDNSLWVFGEYGGGGEEWYTTSDDVPMTQFFVKPLPKATGIKEVSAYNFSIEQNRPNPFNGTTTIDYSLNNNSEVSFRVMDLTGKVVVSRAAEFQSAGSHSISVDANNLKGGIYFYTLTVDGKSLTKKMVVNK